MSAPPLILDKPLNRAVLSAVGDDAVTALVVGSKRLAATLAKAGHAVTLWQTGGQPGGGPLFDAGTAEIERYDVLVLVQVLGRRPEPLEDLRHLVRAARPGGLVVLAESAAWGRGGRWLGRLVGRLLGRPLVSDASELGALCLNAGLTELRQTWPQGLRSLVLTTGRVHALARLLA
jgi:SAM-dependent methyltransferase